jgi:hypothetical protein
MRHTLMLSAPYLVDPKDPRRVGAYPVDSDIFFHFCNAFNDLGWNVCLPTWRGESGSLHLEARQTSDRVDAIMRAGCEQLIVFMDLNYVPTGDTNEMDAIALTRSLVDRYGQKVRVTTFVGDAYMREDLIEILQACAAISDLVISPYQATVDVLNLFGHSDVARKVHTIACVPLRFFAGLNQETADDLRPFDVCYVGSLKKARASALQSVLSIDGVKLNVSTAGRLPESNNPTRQIAAYLDIYLRSAYSICSAAVPRRVIAKLHQGLHVVQPPVFPGRVAESIVCGCLPIYVKDSPDETLPIPKVQDHFPYFEISPETMHRDLPAIVSNRGLIPPLDAFRRYHQRFLCADAVLKPLIDRLWGSQAQDALRALNASPNPSIAASHPAPQRSGPERADQELVIKV